MANLRQFTSKHLWSLIIGSALMASCNSGQNSALRVAGGKFDGGVDGKGEMLYPGTVYVEIVGKDINKTDRLIRNVGTIVDVDEGASQSVALILSTADLFQKEREDAVLPIMETASITIYPSSGNDSDAIKIPQLSLQEKGPDLGYLKNISSPDEPLYYMATIGVKVIQKKDVDEPTKKTFDDIQRKLFLESPLLVGSSNLRNSTTSYVMISIPKSRIRNIRPAKPFFSDHKLAQENLTLVGFGDNPEFSKEQNDSKEKGGGFSLSSNVPDVLKRNFAPIKLISEGTPLANKTKSVPSVGSRLWEVKGSGLCGSKDGSNFDTGAAVYGRKDGKGEPLFLGFGVISASLTNDTRGSSVDCGKVDSEKMATLIVSPSVDEIKFFKANRR